MDVSPISIASSAHLISMITIPQPSSFSLSFGFASYLCLWSLKYCVAHHMALNRTRNSLLILHSYSPSLIVPPRGKFAVLICALSKYNLLIIDEDLLIGSLGSLVQNSIGVRHPFIFRTFLGNLH